MKLELELTKAQEAFKTGSQEIKDFFITAYGAEHFTSTWQDHYSNACKQLGFDELKESEFDFLPESQRTRIFKRHVLATIVQAKRGNWVPDITDHNQRKYYVYVYHNDSNGFWFFVSYRCYDSAFGADLMLPSEDLCNELIKEVPELIKEVLI